MVTRIELRNELRSPEVIAFEKKYAESTGRQTALRDIPIKNFVDTTTGLLEAKVMSTVLRGATDEAGFWPELINVVQMTSPKQDIPIVSPKDFKIRKGKMPRTGNEQSGGKFTKVSLDTTNDEKIRYTYLEIDEEDIKLRNFGVIESAILAAGKAMAKNILTEITAHYVSVAGQSQALGGDKYFVAIMKLLDKVKAAGFTASAIVFESGDFVQAIVEETTGGSMPWLGMSWPGMQPLGDNFASPGAARLSGMVGKLFGTMPVYVVGNDNPGLNGNILAIDAEAGSVFGWAPNGQLEVVTEIQRLNDLVANKIACKYDIKNANASAVGKVTGA